MHKQVPASTEDGSSKIIYSRVPKLLKLHYMQDISLVFVSISARVFKGFNEVRHFVPHPAKPASGPQKIAQSQSAI